MRREYQEALAGGQQAANEEVSKTI